MNNAKKLVLTFTILTLGFGVIALFQNCSPEHKVNSDEFSQYHSNQNHWEPNILKTTYTPNLGDRFYVMSILKDFFGPSAVIVDAAAATGSQLYTRISDYGTPCSTYEDYRILNGTTRTRAVASAFCVYGDRSDSTNASIISNATTGRQGYMINTCTAMVENSKTLAYALTKINGAAYTGAPAMTRQKLTTLYANFYRGRPTPTPGVLDSLQLIFQYETDLTRAWKAAIYSICVSNQWQVL